MALLALHFTHRYVLRVVEVNVVGQVVYLVPWNRRSQDIAFGIALVFFPYRIPPCILIQLMDFLGAIYLITLDGI